ncbi:hypothetical protein PTKIN_Ptkin10aG0125300 [Pterospermum kingtungense]
MGVSLSQVKSKKGNHFCPEESTSEQAHGFGSKCLLSENKQHCGSAITPNESAEITISVSSSDAHLPSSEYVAKNSYPEHLGLLTNGHNHTEKSLCPQETVLGKPYKYDSQYVLKETSEKEHQHGSEIVLNELEEDCTFVCGLPAKHLQSFSEDSPKNAITESLGLSPEDSSKYTQTDKLSCPQLGSSEPTVDTGSGNVCKELGEPPEQVHLLDSKSIPNGIENSSPVVSTKVYELSPEDTNKSRCSEHLQSPPEGAGSVLQTGVQQPRLHCKEMAKNPGPEQCETTHKNLLKNSGQRRDGKTSKTIKKKYMPRSLTSSDRILRSKSQEKPKATESSNILADVGSSEQQKRRKKKRQGAKREVADEYSRIRAHLRYLLNRINYEQSLIAAYSTEGWKGLSLEKLKPEKELQRARSEILRRKLKIRDLFQCIDSLCAEGRLPESLFDCEGEIDSEDIFCAKCGSKDLSANNDIILCDGACDRGFHQYCLQPPLLKEDIPPDDEGWLCPECDCKVDCIELVNESQGTTFSLTDSWEKVFPEAAIAAGGQSQDPNFGLPSDDSDDNDYNPDSSETDEKDQGDESSSDESDFTSTSEELEAPAKVDPYLGLPSDDSEDDDYDPDRPDHDNVVMPENSSSDFTSDSEDLGAMLEDNISSQKDEGAVSINASRDSSRRKPKLGEKEDLNDELISIMESTSGQDVAAISNKRSNERLDYKRLYDETYGSVPSSSSDDEDWSGNTAPRKRKKCTAEEASALANGNASVSSMSVSNNLKQNPEETEHKPRRKTPNFGLPSDDSDDNDYNPDSSETDEKDQGDESSSDESDFTSTSEELEAPAKVDPYLGLPSDDSEDDDYDPDCPDHDNVVMPENSSSDFTSDSEDLGAMLEDNISSQKDEGAVSINASRDSSRRKPKLGEKEDLNDELISIMESTSGQDVAAISNKRSNERLDYKRLYDETYGSVPSSSSDDEDWSGNTAPRKRKKCTAEEASALANGNASVSSMSVSNNLKQNPEETEHKPRRKTPNFGLPSDDSDDNDYNPDSSETDEKDQGDESSSDESDFTSTSEELEAPAKVDPYLGLPSDDSEDDDYDPDCPDHDNVVMPENSSSDFTSDSEDLGAMLEDNISSQKDEGAVSINASRDSSRRKPKLGEKEDLNDELISIMESTSGQDVAAISNKRSNERLDYKRLYDETYGSVPSSSSDDEDWSGNTAPRKRKKCTAEEASALANGNASVSSMSVSNNLKQNPEETEHKPRRKTRQKSNTKDTNLSPEELQGGSRISGSSGKKAGSSKYRILGEAEKQRLYKLFKENHYPGRDMKQSLARELDMTFQQVSKWFEHARWSFKNSPSIKETAAKKVSEK